MDKFYDSKLISNKQTVAFCKLQKVIFQTQADLVTDKTQSLAPESAERTTSVTGGVEWSSDKPSASKDSLSASINKISPKDRITFSRD